MFFRACVWVVVIGLSLCGSVSAVLNPSVDIFGCGLTGWNGKAWGMAGQSYVDVSMEALNPRADWTLSIEFTSDNGNREVPQISSESLAALSDSGFGSDSDYRHFLVENSVRIGFPTGLGPLDIESVGNTVTLSESADMMLLGTEGLLVRQRR